MLTRTLDQPVRSTKGTLVFEAVPVGHYLGFSPLPTLYWPLLAATLVCYVVLTQLVKAALLRLKWI
jgi:hypothetical protein